MYPEPVKEGVKLPTKNKKNGNGDRDGGEFAISGNGRTKSPVSIDTFVVGRALAEAESAGKQSSL